MANIEQIGRAPARGRAAKPGSELDYSIETITPEIAKEWLVANTHNRTRSRAQVARFARDMASGAWKFTADPIRFNGKGGLIDGQHRLMACLEANVPFDALVVRGMALDVQEKLDQGKMRNVADHLALREKGMPRPSIVAATARQLIAIRDEVVDAKDRRRLRPTNAEVLAVYDNHPDVAESVQAIGKPLIGVHPSIIAAIHYCGAFLLKDRETADAFVGVFLNGEPVYAGDAAHLWRERLIAQQTKNASMRRSRIRHGSIHAWNLFRRREPLKIFRIPDDMPKIDGLDVSKI